MYKFIIAVIIYFISGTAFSEEIETSSDLEQLELMMQEIADDKQKKSLKNIYQIEILFFEHNKEDKSINERFPENPGIPNTYFAKQIPEIENNELWKLQDIKSKLSASDKYKVLLHTAWQQKLTLDERSYPMQISHEKLYGTIRVKTVRDIQVIADILFNKSMALKYRMQQKWHLKKNKIYYFDHPKFGFLVMVYPQQESAT